MAGTIWTNVRGAFAGLFQQNRITGVLTNWMQQFLPQSLSSELRVANEYSEDIKVTVSAKEEVSQAWTLLRPNQKLLFNPETSKAYVTIHIGNDDGPVIKLHPQTTGRDVKIDQDGRYENHHVGYFENIFNKIKSTIGKKGFFRRLVGMNIGSVLFVTPCVVMLDDNPKEIPSLVKEYCKRIYEEEKKQMTLKRMLAIAGIANLAFIFFLSSYQDDD